MNLELENKVAVITGGSAGIGLAVAHKLAEEGANVTLCARSMQRVTDAVEQIETIYGVKTLGVVADVTKPDDITKVVEEVKLAFGGADILFNNAGEGTNETIADAPDEKWYQYWDLHVMASLRLSREIVATMKERGGGAIVNNASICARQPLFHEPIYNVTKSALVMLTKCMAHEWIADNIRVNAINPGLIETAGWIDHAEEVTEGKSATWQEYLSGIAREKTPIGRFASPEELADFIAFLCSPRASYCVGSTYYVDGGWLNVTT